VENVSGVKLERRNSAPPNVESIGIGEIQMNLQEYNISQGD
jgi:hypothetical protein